MGSDARNYPVGTEFKVMGYEWAVWVVTSQDPLCVSRKWSDIATKVGNKDFFMMAKVLSLPVSAEEHKKKLREKYGIG